MVRLMKGVKKQKEVVEKKGVGVKGFEDFTVLQGELRGSKSNIQRSDTEKRPGQDLLSENELISHILYNGTGRTDFSPH